MLKKCFYTMIFLLLGASSQLMAQADPTEKMRAEALSFSLKFIETFFTEDCATYYNMIDDDILVLEEDTIIPKKRIKAKICESQKEAVRDNTKTFEDYLAMYQIKMLTVSELEQQIKKEYPDFKLSKQIKPNDFFFMGTELKTGIDKSDDFIWNDCFLFMVRKVDGKWVFKAAAT